MPKLLIRIALILLIAVGAAVLLASTGWFEQRDDGVTAPVLIRQEALAAAKQQNKRLLLWFTARYENLSGIDYPGLLEAFHADPEVARVLDRYFVVKRIDIEHDFGGLHVYLDAGQVRGVPAFTILDAHGQWLADSGPDSDTNFGFPDAPEQLDAYEAALKRACPEMTAPELALLREKLIEIRAGQKPATADGASSAGC